MGATILNLDTSGFSERTRCLWSFQFFDTLVLSLALLGQGSVCLYFVIFTHAVHPTNYTVSYVIYIDVSMSYLILHNMFWIYDIYVLDLQLSSYTQTVTGHVPVISTSVALRPGGCRRRVDVARCN